MSRRLFALAVGLALLVGVTLAAAAQPETQAADDAVAYIETLQNTDGGFPAFGTGSSPGSTIDVVFAVASVGQDPTTTITSGNSPADYLATQAASYASDPGAAAKLALSVSVMGLDPTNFAALDLMAILSTNFDAVTGIYGLDIFDEAFYVHALAGAGAPVPATATQYLESVQQIDGGWEFSSGFGSDSNTTALVIQALLAAGVGETASSVVDGLGYLGGVQNADGGFGFLAASSSDPNSTAFVIQALVAAGENIDVGGPWAPGGSTPLAGLLAFRNPVTGAFQFGGVDSAFATYQAVPALMLAPFPDLETSSTAVGGIAELPQVAEAPLEVGDSSVRGYGVAAGVALAVAVGAAALGGLAWQTRRRRIR